MWKSVLLRPHYPLPTGLTSTRPDPKLVEVGEISETGEISEIGLRGWVGWKACLSLCRNRFPKYASDMQREREREREREIGVIKEKRVEADS